MAAIAEVKKVPAFTTVWHLRDMQGLYDPLTKESTAFQNSKNVYQDVDPNCAKIKEYKELEGEELPGSGGLSARQMARVIYFLEEQWGLFPCSNTGCGQLPVCSCTKGYPAKKGGYQHTHQKIYGGKNVQVPHVFLSISA